MAREKRRKMGGHSYRSHAGPPTAMRDAKSLVQIEMTDVGADVARPAQSHLRIHIGPVHIHLRPVLMRDFTDAPDAFFKDPFNEVRGVGAIASIFLHMYERVEQPRFVITHRALNGPDAFLVWDFIFKMPRISDAPQGVRGATHLRFNAAGKVEMHRDYWDAAEELYEKLPVLGAFMRWIKRRTNA